MREVPVRGHLPPPWGRAVARSRFAFRHSPFTSVDKGCEKGAKLAGPFLQALFIHDLTQGGAVGQGHHALEEPMTQDSGHTITVKSDRADLSAEQLSMLEERFMDAVDLSEVSEIISEFADRQIVVTFGLA